MGQSMSSLAPECNEAKKKYDDCFTVWYDKFLKGESNQNECQGQFDTYQTCVQAALVKNKALKTNLEKFRENAPFEKGGAPRED